MNGAIISRTITENLKEERREYYNLTCVKDWHVIQLLEWTRNEVLVESRIWWKTVFVQLAKRSISLICTTASWFRQKHLLMSLLNLHCIVFRWSIPEKTHAHETKNASNVCQWTSRFLQGTILKWRYFYLKSTFYPLTHLSQISTIPFKDNVMFLRTPGTLQKGRLSVSVESELPIFLLLKFSPLKVLMIVIYLTTGALLFIPQVDE